MIINADIPIQFAKFGDIIRYWHNDSLQVDIIWNMPSATSDHIEVVNGRRAIRPDDILRITRPVTVRVNDRWTLSNESTARIICTDAVGTSPIVAIIESDLQSVPVQFCTSGISSDNNLRLFRPVDMEVV